MMEGQTQHIQQRLVANMLMEACARCDGLLFRDAWCTQDRVIRFATPFFRNLFSVKEGPIGFWKTGDFVMYEVNNLPEDVTIDCVFTPTQLPRGQREAGERLMRACGAVNTSAEAVVLKSWRFSSDDPNQILRAFGVFLRHDLPEFEAVLIKKLAAKASFAEGAVQRVTLSKYERNRKARAACLAIHGTACAVCGLDFGKVYGPEFVGVIQVHHTKPLSEIGERYEVDPAHDLVPVCPNCHTALHCKPGGVYTIKELKTLIQRKGDAK